MMLAIQNRDLKAALEAIERDGVKLFGHPGRLIRCVAQPKLIICINPRQLLL